VSTVIDKKRRRCGAPAERIRGISLELAQSTLEMDWRQVELVIFAGEETAIAEEQVCLPEEDGLHALHLEREGDGFVLKEDPLGDRVEWRIFTITA
jgi:hypothetical protein